MNTDDNEKPRQSSGAHARTKILRARDLAVVVPFVLLLLLIHWHSVRQRHADASLLESADSFYNRISVYGLPNGARRMVFSYRRGKFYESVHKPGQPLDLEMPYTRLMTVGLAYDPEPKDVLSIGMGGGAVSSYMLAALPQPHITEVELDPEVVRLSKRYFDYADTPRRTVAVEDGRKFLMTDSGRYDMVLLDAYRGPFVPFHLLTREFYAEVKRHLLPGGVVVQNIDTGTLLADSVIATLKASFDQVDSFPSGENVIVVAYDGARRDDALLQRSAQAMDARYKLPYSLQDMIATRAVASAKPGTQPLTDDFAPVDTLHAIAKHNEKWQ